MLALLLLVVVACASGSDGAGDEGGGGDRSEAPVAETELTTPPELSDPKEVLAAVAESIVFIETPLATGSGIVVADGFVLTNAHVPDPLTMVDVTFGDGTTATDVPVAGTDLLGDLALIGPLDEATDVAALELTDELPEKGDDVFLVGYPGEVDEAPEVTISKGIVSRIRDDDDFDLSYIQTDAAIGGGQSGGALVDTRGRVLGMSGLGGFAESFALVLSGADVLAARDRIDDGSAIGYGGFPTDDTVSEGTFVVDDELDQVTLVLRTSGTEPLRLRVDGPADLAVDAFSLDGEDAFGNAVSVESYAEYEDDPDYDDELLDLPEPELVELVDGAYAFPFDDGTLVEILVTPLADDRGEIRWSTDQPVSDVSDTDPVPFEPPLALGESVEGVIRAGELYDVHAIQLRADQEVVVRAVAPNAGDPWVTVVEPEGTYYDTDVLEGIPSDGIFDVGTEDDVSVERGGRHLVVVESGDGLSMLYRLTISED